MKSKPLFATFVLAFTASFAAAAAEDMGKGMGADKEIVMPADKMETAAQPVEKKVKPHNHYEVNKQGVAPTEKSETIGAAKKPLHDHMKVHKQW